jgi:hypothetical protein
MTRTHEARHGRANAVAFMRPSPRPTVRIGRHGRADADLRPNASAPPRAVDRGMVTPMGADARPDVGHCAPATSDTGAAVAAVSCTRPRSCVRAYRVLRGRVGRDACTNGPRSLRESARMAAPVPADASARTVRCEHRYPAMGTRIPMRSERHRQGWAPPDGGMRAPLPRDGRTHAGGCGRSFRRMRAPVRRDGRTHAGGCGRSFRRMRAPVRRDGRAHAGGCGHPCRRMRALMPRDGAPIRVACEHPGRGMGARITRDAPAHIAVWAGASRRTRTRMTVDWVRASLGIRAPRPRGVGHPPTHLRAHGRFSGVRRQIRNRARTVHPREAKRGTSDERAWCP